MGLPNGLSGGSLSDCGRRRDVRHRPQRRSGAGHPHRARVVDVEAAHSEGLPEHRIRPGQSRPGHPERPGLRRHARLLPGGTRREERPRTMVVQGGGLQARIQHDTGAAGIPRQGLVGVSGGETGIRGFVDAYDAKTGSRAWRFYTIPGPGEPGHETWPGDSWKTGGGSTWVTGSYDPQTNLVYWGIGNPGPDWNPDSRRGDNLYTCSLVALDGDTGKRKWHFQFTPNDSHDWDSPHLPVLFDGEVRGARQKPWPVPSA